MKKPQEKRLIIREMSEKDIRYIGIALIIYIYKFFKKQKKREWAEPYYIKTKCPICDHQWNRVRYLKGDKPYGARVECERCGNKYIHHYNH